LSLKTLLEIANERAAIACALQASSEALPISDATTAATYSSNSTLTISFMFLLK